MRGLRNSVAFDWDPRTRELWFTNSGRGRLGDDLPADTLNHAPRWACASIRAQFPPAYRNQIFIAEHGSWNRSKKIGYRVTVVRVENNRAVGYEPFATGWLEGETAWGRPADVLVMPDGSLLVSDDLAGAI
jgi:glucose/arabinose dehydrogenase